MWVFGVHWLLVPIRKPFKGQNQISCLQAASVACTFTAGAPSERPGSAEQEGAELAGGARWCG